MNEMLSCRRNDSNITETFYALKVVILNSYSVTLSLLKHCMANLNSLSKLCQTKTSMFAVIKLFSISLTTAAV